MNTLINLDYQSRIPIYEQIIIEIERYVSLGVFKSGEQIYSIRELATKLGINPNTVKKAYEELERRKVINMISTKGTFISKNVEIIIDNRVKGIVDNIQLLFDELYKYGIKKTEIIKKIK